jgi:hypothetical protein
LKLQVQQNWIHYFWINKINPKKIAHHGSFDSDIVVLLATSTSWRASAVLGSANREEHHSGDLADGEPIIGEEQGGEKELRARGPVEKPEKMEEWPVGLGVGRSGRGPAMVGRSGRGPAAEGRSSRGLAAAAVRVCTVGVGAGE